MHASLLKLHEDSFLVSGIGFFSLFCCLTGFLWIKEKEADLPVRMKRMSPNFISVPWSLRQARR